MNNTVMVADTINDIGPKEMQVFEKKTSGWSGDDIVALFSDLYTTYMSRVIDASYFKKVSLIYSFR